MCVYIYIYIYIYIYSGALACVLPHPVFCTAPLPLLCTPRPLLHDGRRQKQQRNSKQLSAHSLLHALRSGHIYIYIYTYIYLSLSIYIYISMHNIYIYTHTCYPFIISLS